MDDGGCLDRRGFLRLAGLTVVVSAVDPTLVRAGGGTPLETLPTRRRGAGRTLVYLFQRFGPDGLNVVVPTEAGEHALYRRYRPTLAVDRANPDLGRLDADFALHPVMKAGLHDLWRKGLVAVFPNVGYPDASRSHFDAQLYLDRGTPQDKTTAAGWLNRWMQAQPPSGDPLRALAFGPSLPVALEGPVPAVAIADLRALSVTTASPQRNARFFAVQERVYGQPPRRRRWDAELAASGRALVEAVQAVGPALPAPGVAYPAGSFAASLRQLAQLLRSDLFEIEVAEIDFGGWDTHSHQQTGLVSGTFPTLLAQFSDGIAAFVRDLGPERMARTLLLTTSEFGRTARENGSRGTDHGSAWASFAVGGKVRPGVHFGPSGWASLADLREERDLKHSLDFRDLFGEALARHMGSLPPAVFPGFRHTPVGYL